MRTSNGDVRSRRQGRVLSSSEQIFVNRVGLDIRTLLSYDRWREAGIRIARIADSSAWCLGDWLVYGQEMYTDRYQQAIAAAGLDYQTLRNYAWVARRFAMHRRREQLSLQHHAEVAALTEEEQDRWLDMAEKHSWSRNQLREQLRKSRDEQRGSVAQNADAMLPRLSVTRERLQRWCLAAEKSCGRLEPWLISSLDRAASEVLGEIESQ